MTRFATTLSVLLSLILLLPACSTPRRSGGGGGGGGGGSSTGGDEQPREVCDGYLQCLGSVDPERFAAEHTVYGPDGTCWETGSQFAGVCASACTEARVDLWEDDPYNELCRIPWPNGSLPSSVQSTGAQVGDVAPVITGVDQYSESLSLDAFYGRFLVVSVGVEWMMQMDPWQASWTVSNVSAARGVDARFAGLMLTQGSGFDAQDWAQDVGIWTDPLLTIEGSEALAADLELQSPHTFVIIDPDWRVRARVDLNSGDLEQALEQAILDYEAGVPLDEPQDQGGCGGSTSTTEDESNDSPDQATRASGAGEVVLSGVVSTCSNDGEQMTGDLDWFLIEDVCAGDATLNLSWAGEDTDIDFAVWNAASQESVVYGTHSDFAGPEFGDAQLDGNDLLVLVGCWDGAPTSWSLTIEID
jgi:hypothetical protein